MKTLVDFVTACTAGAHDGLARCIRMAVAKGRCKEHQGSTTSAPKADVVLISVNMSWQEAQEFASNGVMWREKDSARAAEVRGEQIARARAFGRNPFKQRPGSGMVDGNAQVFGKGGVIANLTDLQFELKGSGLHLTDVHLEGGADLEKGKKLILYFSEGDVIDMPPSLVRLIDKRLGKTVKAHVWCNSVDMNGICTHTVNTVDLKGEDTDTDAFGTVIFANGDWALGSYREARW